MNAGPTTDGALEPAASPARPALSRPAVPLLVLAVTVAAACTVTSGPGTETVRAILSIGPEGSGAAQATAEPANGVPQGSLEVPDTVRVGKRFTATVRTIGRNGCWSPADEDVSVDGLTATIVPFDSTGQREGVACTMALTSLLHDVNLSFGEPGEAVVRVEGRRVIDREGADSEPMSMESTLTVLP